MVGLYIAPPENAIVICVDEALDPGPGACPGLSQAPEWAALTGHSHHYKRNGTSTLFAAFEVATGKVTTAHKNRRGALSFSSS